jgi:hypothetical protein
VALAVAVSCLPDLEVAPLPGACGNGAVALDDGAACDPGDGSLGCSATCQIVCDGGVVDDATNHCYFWTQPVISLDMAIQNGCGVSAHPVSFVDLAELTFVVSNAKGILNASSGGSWLALEKGQVNDAGYTTYYAPNLQVPGWAASCVGCFAYTDASDIPLNINVQQCVDWKHLLTSQWYQAACTLGITDAGVQNTSNVLCEREPPGSFSAPCTDDASAGNICIEVPVTHTTKRYELAGVPADFSLAQSGCVALKGSLVHFESAAEREEVVTEVERSMATDFWIGLAFDADAGTWTWVDGTAAPYVFPTPWGDLEPSMNAPGVAAAIHIEPLSSALSYTTRLARAEDSSTLLPYVCEFAK